MIKKILSITALSSACLVGCTNVTVKPVEKGCEPGLRYYLPQPFLIVTPNEDGSLDIRVENLADRSQAYAVTAKSYLASHKLVLKLNQGLLTEASLTQDSSAVAAETVKSAGEVRKAKIDAETTVTTKAKESQETEAKTQRDDIKKLKDSLAQAEVEAAQATAERDAVAASGAVDAKTKLDAEVAAKKAEAKVNALKAQLSAATSLAGFNVARIRKAAGQAPPAAGQAPPAATPPVPPVTPFRPTDRPGPVVLMIKEDDTGVLELVAINFDSEPQKTFNGYKIPDKPLGTGEKQNDPPKSIEFQETAISVQVGNAPLTREIKLKVDIEGIAVAKMSGSKGKIDQKLWPDTKWKDSKTFDLIFKANTPPDTYDIVFLGTVKSSLPKIEGELKATVLP